MRQIPDALTAKWNTLDFTGPNRPVTRVAIQKAVLQTKPVGDQVFATLLFSGANEFMREMPNLKSVRWERTVDGDAATCTIELYNTAELPPGDTPDTAGNFDQAGYYTYNRGQTEEMRDLWGVTRNDWAETLIPDRVIRTYQGLGADYGVSPENDPNLVLTGMWIIDDVTYTADGLITVECRDFARLLLDQIMFPPVVPFKKYPLKFEKYNTVTETQYLAGWLRPTYDTSTTGTTSVYGHHGSDAVDSDDFLTYWLSNGHSSPTGTSAFEWWQGKFTGQGINAVKVKVRGGPYRCYLSVYTDKAAGGKITGWNGIMKVPTTVSGAAITYSKSAVIPYNNTGLGGEYTFTFPKVVGMTKVRLSFTSLYNSAQGTAPYRVALRDLQVAGDAVPTNVAVTHGNYGDYSQIVKLLLAYGGFYWPQGAAVKLSGTESTVPGVPSFGNTVSMAPAADDSYLVKGGVWGDIQMSGTAGKVDLDVPIWDKKPLLDGINYVKDILGFMFSVDENGAAIFRSPNLFRLGNWMSDVNGLNTERTTDYTTISSDHALIDLRAKLSSRNIREKVFIADVTGRFGAVASGILPTLGTASVNFRRVGGWTDQNFESEDECKVMAELIMLRQMFSFRTDSIRIPALPSIQCDDQVKIYEQITGEAYFHYVRGISSTWDADTGAWYYDLTTNWLGNDPATDWAFNPAKLDPATQTYLTALGQI